MIGFLRAWLRILSVLVLTIGSWARADEGFLFVLEDDDTLAATTHGSYRAMYAEAVRAAARGGARAVALKFFFLEPDVAGDAPLAAAMGEVPTYLQYALRGDPAIGNPAPAALGVAAGSIGAEWMASDAPDFPVPELANVAAGLGFVDARSDFDLDVMPALGSLDGRAVPALQTALLGARFPGLAVTAAGLDAGGRRVPIAADGTVRCEVEELPDDVFVSLGDLLEERVPAARLADAVVVIGYDGVDAPRFSTGFFSSRSAHPMFMDRLRCVEALFGG